jgi:hypothetical protein
MQIPESAPRKKKSKVKNYIVINNIVRVYTGLERKKKPILEP